VSGSQLMASGNQLESASQLMCMHLAASRWLHPTTIEQSAHPRQQQNSAVCHPGPCCWHSLQQYAATEHLLHSLLFCFPSLLHVAHTYRFLRSHRWNIVFWSRHAVCCACTYTGVPEGLNAA
jgi:hypothetical protein